LENRDGVIQAVLQIPPVDAEAFFPIREAVQKALEALDGVSRARVVLSAHKAGPQVGGRARANPHQAKRPAGVQGDGEVKRIVAISSAKGGVGKSTKPCPLPISHRMTVPLFGAGRSFRGRLRVCYGMSIGGHWMSF